MTDEEKRSDEAEEATKPGESEALESSSPEEKSAEEAAAAADSEEKGAEKSSAEEPPKEEANVAAAVAHSHEDHSHGHGDHGHGDHSHGHGDHGHGDHDEHLGHTAPISLLVGVLLALGMLTVLTVAVTAVDLGSQGNFVVAMIIATVKAILVMGYFMHMFWDSRFNVVAFTSSFLFVLLFLAMAVLDGSEYQKDVKTYENDKKAQM